MKHLIKSLILISSLTSISAIAQDAFQFKGVKVNDTLDEAKSKLGLRCFTNTKTTIEQTTCYRTGNNIQSINFGGAQVITGQPIVKLLNNKVSLITAEVSINFYQQVSEALIEKYGKPKISKSKNQTKVGVEYENELLTWENQSSTMTFEKFSSTIENSSFTLKSNDFNNKMITIKKEEAKINSEDL